MIEQVCSTKEYSISSGVLIIENIVKGAKKKSDIIREIIEYMICPDGADLVQSVCRNTADYGSHAKEAEN